MAVANTSPQFVGSRVISSARISTANTNRDGSGTVGTVATGGTLGTRIDRVTICANQSTTAGMVRLFAYDGTNSRLIKEVPVTLITVAADTPGFTAELVRTDGLPWLELPVNHQLRASTHNAEQFDVVAYGGDY